MKLEAHLAAAAVLLASLLQPAVASAAKHHRADSPSFPMTAAEFRTYADKRVEHIWEVIERKLDRRSVSPDRKKAMRKVFDEVAKEAKAEVDKAAADGKVTEAEGEKWKRVVVTLRGKFRERLAAERKGKGSTGAAHAKADKKSKAEKGPTQPAKAVKKASSKAKAESVATDA